MNKLIETAKELDRILESGIEILPNSPIHEKLKQALNIACINGSISDKAEMINALTNTLQVNKKVLGEYYSIRDKSIKKLEALLDSV